MATISYDSDVSSESHSLYPPRKTSPLLAYFERVPKGLYVFYYSYYCHWGFTWFEVGPKNLESDLVTVPFCDSVDILVEVEV